VGTYCSGGTCVPANGDAPSSQFTCTDNIQCISRVCSGVFGDSTPHCHVCNQSYSCPITAYLCTLNDDCQSCSPADTVNCNTNGTAKCSVNLCPANASDCDAATLQCHCGALDKCA